MIGRAPSGCRSSFIQNRMVGNPAIGINSDCACLVSTTWELVGRYPEDGVGAKAMPSPSSPRRVMRTSPGTIIYTKANEVTGGGVGEHSVCRALR